MPKINGHIRSKVRKRPENVQQDTNDQQIREARQQAERENEKVQFDAGLPSSNMQLHSM